MSKHIRRSALALAVFFTALLVTGAVDAGPNTSTVPRDSNRITLVRGLGGVVGSPDGYADIPGARALVNVAQGEVLKVTFGTALSCSGPEVATFCNVRVITTRNGISKELLPGGARFDSVTGPDDDFESHMATWSTDPLAAGEYLVRVQYTAREKQDKPLAIAKMLRWHLEIERLAA
jgi:hypothetical protein